MRFGLYLFDEEIYNYLQLFSARDTNNNLSITHATLHALLAHPTLFLNLKYQRLNLLYEIMTEKLKYKLNYRYIYVTILVTNFLFNTQLINQGIECLCRFINVQNIQDQYADLVGLL